MRTSRRTFLQGLLCSMSAVVIGSSMRLAAASDAEPLRASSVVILSRTGAHRFHVELAETALQRMQGLQARRTLDAQAGMLFVFDVQSAVSMWMKDTYIPLDMLFLDAGGSIVAIARNTRPMSLQPLRAPAPVKAVLELDAGTAERFGIEVGHRVLHPIFDSAKPR